MKRGKTDKEWRLRCMGDKMVVLQEAKDGQQKGAEGGMRGQAAIEEKG